MQAHQLSSLRRVMVLMAVATFAVIAMTACGGDDGDTASALPTQAPAPTATATPAEPTATSMPEPPAAPMIPATVPEPGSDEAQIMAVLEKQVIAVNTADYESFLETCTPSARRPPTIAQLKYIYEENRGRTGSGTPFINFSPQGYNVRNVEVKLLRAPFAQATLHVYDYDKHLRIEDIDTFLGGEETVTRTFEKVDGQWYSEVAPC